jgi:hypothetical protein
MLETAQNAVELGVGTAEWTLLVDHGGGVQLIEGGAGDLRALSASRGAQAAWRLTRRGGKLRVEGQNGTERCLLEATARDGAWRRVLGDCRLYAQADRG